MRSRASGLLVVKSGVVEGEVLLEGGTLRCAGPAPREGLRLPGFGLLAGPQGGRGPPHPERPLPSPHPGGGTPHPRLRSGAHAGVGTGLQAPAKLESESGSKGGARPLVRPGGEVQGKASSGGPPPLRRTAQRRGERPLLPCGGGPRGLRGKAPHEGALPPALAEGVRGGGVPQAGAWNPEPARGRKGPKRRMPWASAGSGSGENPLALEEFGHRGLPPSRRGRKVATPARG